MRLDGDAQAGQPKPPAPLELNSAALQLTMKWIEHASEASELAVSDTRLAEGQARAIGQFFNVLRETIKANFGPEPSDKKEQEQAQASESPAGTNESLVSTAVAPGGAPTV